MSPTGWAIPLHYTGCLMLAIRNGQSLTIRGVRILSGHTKVKSAVKHLGIEVDDAPEMSEQTEI